MAAGRVCLRTESLKTVAACGPRIITDNGSQQGMFSAQRNQRGIVQVVVLHDEPGLNHGRCNSRERGTRGQSEFSVFNQFVQLMNWIKSQSMQLTGTRYARTEQVFRFQPICSTTNSVREIYINPSYPWSKWILQ